MGGGKEGDDIEDEVTMVDKACWYLNWSRWYDFWWFLKRVYRSWLVACQYIRRIWLLGLGVYCCFRY